MVQKLSLEVSSHINEVTETILDFFIQKFDKHKKHQTLTTNKSKNALKKHLRGKKPLIRLFAFCAFAYALSLCLWVILVLLVRTKSFRENKGLKLS